ncbi:MAG: peptidyl-prolyl cis-trans isomerase [Caldilineaceae bacterium]|nr:peptidyl-prolyl cis-trans isomerase [Caldilineaceae bacterium]
MHFLLLGGLLFAVDHFLNARANDLHTIYVDAAVDNQARQVFKEARGREPNEDELYALRKVWLDHEVLYREGLALGVDKGDSAIRERVIFKALSIVDANIKLPPYDDRVLRDWFEQHRVKYDEPARYDFQEAVLSGDNSETAVRAFVATLNTGAPGDAKAGLRVFKGRPQANIVQSYGEEFAEALRQSPTGVWQALPTREGWRAIRLESIMPPKPADYEVMRGVALQDWKDATAAELRSAAVRDLAKKYTVEVEAAAP